MKKYGKAGLLIFTLVMPALVFVFLDRFGSNHYVLPYFNPETDVKGDIEMENGDTVFAKVERINLLELTDNANIKPSLIGHYTVLNYIQSNRPDSLKVILAQLERIHVLRKNIKPVQVISIVDSTSVGSWKTSLQDGWLFVSGNSTTVDSVVNGDLQLGSNRKDVPTFSKLQLVDDQGYTRGYYDAMDPDEIERLMAEIKILNYERGKSLGD